MCDLELRVRKSRFPTWAESSSQTGDQGGSNACRHGPLHAGMRQLTADARAYHSLAALQAF